MALVPIFVVWGKITNSLGSKFVVIAFSFIIHAENPFFIGTWFHGSNPQRKPRKLVPHENGHIHSMSTICWSYSHLLLRYLLNMHSINSPILQSPGGIIIYGALWLFDEDFVHVVSITFSALILTELLMVALTIRTWHYLMIIAEVFSLSYTSCHWLYWKLILVSQMFMGSQIKFYAPDWMIAGILFISCLSVVNFAISFELYGIYETSCKLLHPWPFEVWPSKIIVIPVNCLFIPPGAYSYRIVRPPSICLSVRLSVITNKVQYLKFGWWYSNLGL